MACTGQPWRRGLLTAAAVGVLTAASACSAGHPARATGELAAGTQARPGTPSCPSTYAAPDPDRPRTRLVFDVAADLGTVTGHEHVVFTPDAGIDSVVFRLLPNGIESHRTAGDLRVTGAAVVVGTGGSDSGAPAPLPAPPAADYTSAGARPGTPGTILRLALPRPVRAGEPVVVDLDFTLTLPPAGFDRYGHDATSAWWGSGHPLLAWVRGHGWATDPVAAVPAETAASEAADTDLTVTAPAELSVLASGVAERPADAGPGRQRWHFHSPTARDVGVMISAFRLATATVAGVAVQVGVATGVSGPAAEAQPAASPSPSAGPAGGQPTDQLAADVLSAVAANLPAQAARYGPVPFAAVSLALLPGLGGAGVEYPGAIMLGPSADYSVVAHELAHQWFYGLVGDDQGAHPWLDEGFATYDAAIQTGSTTQYSDALSQVSDRVDQPTTAFGDGPDTEARYNDVVYTKAAAALLAARSAAGTAAFDAAMRCYVRANAWRVVDPSDVERAFAPLPAALTELRLAGAV
jgi:hypothetical protein